MIFSSKNSKKENKALEQASTKANLEKGSKALEAVAESSDSNTENNNEQELNYAGLDAKFFDILQTANKNLYPYITNLETGLTRVSPEWVKFFNLPGEYVRDFATVWGQLIHPDDREGYFADVQNTLNRKQDEHHYKYRVKKPADKDKKDAKEEYVYCVCHGKVYSGENENPDLFVGFIENHGVEQIFDYNTGLPTIATMDKKLQSMLRKGERGYLMELSINGMTRIDMLYDHSGGKRYVRNAIQVIQGILGDVGELYCQENYRFASLLRLETKAAVRGLYAKISEALGQGSLENSDGVPLRISGGAVYINRNDMKEIKDYHSALISALLESEKAQHGQVVFYEDMTATSATANLELLKDIHEDSTSGCENFSLRYQPLVEAQTGKLASAEALVRYIHPKYGEISPKRFIEFIENDPCYFDVGLRLIQISIQFAKKVRERVPDFTVNVNITSDQLQNVHFTEKVLEVVHQENYPPQGLMLELTERCKELNTEFLSDKIGELRSNGFLVALDDVGTGYSTVNLLMDIPVDEVKLDYDFTKAIKTNPMYPVFARFLFDSAAISHNRVVFEGVESFETVEYLKTLGPATIQGFCISKPMREKDFLEFLDKNLKENGSVL